ncbi:DEAD/DEAH box helicase [Cohnella lubricantis]|uniref:SNF2 helicase associated domain-containing protein n=1 Tax=Cohnella lubricantis TaxID=2163172 RepID=A0A841T921_9BACL|nr:DEAD/DEAH box helicase [Cohnella lubricantis]MBB6675740.1 SNF2 helicase associated domain-containing protein [Cohnella lubricantis]MBP2118884.1 SNF2 family DNA or RNA helicase [Cohnella lubricantis]
MNGRSAGKPALNERAIRSLCGETAYRKGEAYCRAGKVSLALSEMSGGRTLYDAAIKDNGNCRVTLALQGDELLQAECVCSAGFSFDTYCKHVAAALLRLLEERRIGEQRRGEPEGFELPGAEDSRIASRVLELFKREPRPSSGVRSRFESREQLAAEFTVAPYRSGPRRRLLGIELRVGPGPGKTYAVPDIRELLGCYERGQALAVSRHFTYDPASHCFEPEAEAILLQLLEVRRDERLQREAVGALYTGEVADTRTLPIPPQAWAAIAPKLAAAPLVKVSDGERIYDGVELTEEPLPLRFAFDQIEGEGFQLDVQGLEGVLMMEPYSMALSEGRFFRLRPAGAGRLAELQKILRSGERDRILIPPGQMESFMERVVPGLMQLGEVHISRTVSDRMVRAPLEARIYLDRLRDRLLVGLEFQYGDIVINPLEEAGAGARQGESRILVREGERETRILELLESAGFARNESSYFMEDEDSEYDFLHHVVPQLEKLARIYATSAVKERLYIGNPPPNVSVELDERTNWLEFRFEMDGIPESEIRGIIQALEEKRRYYRLPDGALMPLETEEFQEMIRFLNEVALPRGEIVGSKFRLPAARGLHLLDARDRDRDRGGLVRLGRSIRLLLERLRNPDHMEFAVPDALAPVLRDYQQFGYQWLKTLAHYRFGGILADDMGLGKTIQSIAYLVSVLPEIRARRQPALIVAPASLMYNWLSELRRFAPGFRAVIADGDKSERARILNAAEEADAVIVSYPLLRRDIARYAKLSFHTLILDEAQAFKNYATQTARAVKALSAEYRFALTGTPIENSLDELWSIFDAVFPGLYPDRKAYGGMTREAIAKRARPFLLRRLKRDVLRELPEKIESMQVSELLPEQKKLYAAYLAKLRQETLKHLDEGFGRSRIRILAGLTRLRQICCHPALFVEDYAGGSAKLAQLLEMIEDCRQAGRRMLVFSQFTEMLGIIGKELGYRGVPFFYLDGSTPASERVELCDRFNEGERDLFLISLKAGGTGLNLTGADTVVLYDLWWNPAVEQQAEDRAHRIGQKKVVQVIRLVSRGTVEEKMHQLQQRKKTLIAEVIQPGEEALAALTEEDILELLSMEAT